MITPDQLAASGTEHGLQCALFCWRNQQVKSWREIREWRNDCTEHQCNQCVELANNADKLELMFAIPNGGARHAAVAANLKAEGVKPGVPDIFLPVSIYARNKKELGAHQGELPGYSGLFIELKQQKYRNRARGGCSEDQAAMIEALRAQGYCVVICYTWQEARDTVLHYLGVKQ